MFGFKKKEIETVKEIKKEAVKKQSDDEIYFQLTGKHRSEVKK